VSISVYSWFFFFAWVAAIPRRYLLFKSVLAPCREAFTRIFASRTRSSFGLPNPAISVLVSNKNRIDNLIL
jgi:hypothetical protein